MATFQDIADAEELPEALRSAVRLTASRTLRNMMTLGGELGRCPDDSALIPVLIALDATVSVAGQKRPVPVQTYLITRRNELVLSVSLPDAGTACAVRAVSRTSHSFRSVVVAVSLGLPRAGQRSALIIASDCRGRRARVSVALADGRAARPVIEAAVKEAFDPQPDMHASSDYKRTITGVLAADAILGLTAEGTPL
jgi:probable selenate reductase FAD-binding subunit